MRFPLISHLNRVRSGYEFIFPLYLNPWNRLNGKLMILIPLFTVFNNRGPSTYTPCGRSLFTWSFNLRYQADTAKNKMDRCPRSEKNSLPYQSLCHPLRRYCIFNVSMETKQSGNNQPQKLQIRMLKLLLLFELRKPRDRPFNFDWLPSVISTSVSKALDFNITMKRWIIDEFWIIFINIKIKKRWARSIVRNYDELFFRSQQEVLP